jgi:hypothetical protein
MISHIRKLILEAMFPHGLFCNENLKQQAAIQRLVAQGFYWKPWDWSGSRGTECYQNDELKLMCLIGPSGTITWVDKSEGKWKKVRDRRKI